MIRVAIVLVYVMIGLGVGADEYARNDRLDHAMMAWVAWPCVIGFGLSGWANTYARSETPPKAAKT